MTDATHTPGPWKVSADPDATAQQRRCTTLHDARFVDGPSGHVCAMRDQASQQADARLISAAPDLLAALRVLTGFAEAHDGETLVREHLKIARAAILKATT